MSEVTWTDPLVFGTGLTNPSSDLRDVRKVEGGRVGLYSRIHLCFWYFLFFPPKFSFSAFCSHLRLWCWVWAARWKSWRGCPASFGWPCTAAPLPPGQGLQLPVQWCGSGGGIHTYSASRIMDEMTHHKCCVCLPPSCTVRRCGIYNDAESGRDCRSGRNLLTVWCPKIEMRIWEQCFKQQRKKTPKLFQKWIQFYESQTALKTHSRVGVLYHLSHTPHTFTLKLVLFFLTVIINSVSMATSIAHLVRDYKFPMVTNEPIKRGGIFDILN